MTAKRFTFPVTLTLAVALALGVTSCAPDATPVEPTPTVSASTPAVTEPTVDPTTDAPVVVEPTEAPAPELPTAYIGGVQVPIDPALPLPEAVIEAVRAVTTANTAAIVAANPSSNGESVEAGVASDSAMSSGRAMATDLSEATGRTVFIISQVYGSTDGDHYDMLWAVLSNVNVPSTKVRASASKDAVVNGLTAWVAAQPDPSAYEIIVG